jgi:DNA-directed RNA polymerase subunit F
MTTPTVISDQPLHLYEVKKELKAIKKRDEQLSVRANRVDEYVNMFTPLSEKAASELKEKLKALDVPRMKEEYLNKLIDVLPVNEDDIKTILTGYGVTVKNENVAKMNELIAEYRK